VGLLCRHRPCAAIPAITTPSQALQHHPRHCGSAGRQDASTPAVVPRTAPRQLHLESAHGRRPNGRLLRRQPLLDGHKARHNAPPEARFTRTTVSSAALYAIPSHVTRTVRHACKRPPPWPIKGGAVPLTHGDDRQHSDARSLPSPRYWHLASIKPQGPGGPASSPASLVAPLGKHHDATQYSASSTPLLDVRPRPEPG
jgi:hypothetical protein